MRTEGVCRERPKHNNVGMAWRENSHWPSDPTDNIKRRGIGYSSWDLLLTEDLGVWMTPALRLITLLDALRHLMLLGPRSAGGWVSWPNNDCSLDSRSSSTGHRVQHSVMKEACQCQPFLSRVSSALDLGRAMPRRALCTTSTRNCYVSVSVIADGRSAQP